MVLRGSAGGSEHREAGQDVNARPNLLAGEELASKPVQKRSLAKRERLKAAGLALFGEKGYENTSINEIARRAKLAVGSFYQHFRSKRQLLLALMDELLEKLSQLNLQPQGVADVRAGIRAILARAFAHDLKYLGAYRAWQEAALSDLELVKKQEEIHRWTTGRVMGVFQFLQGLPGARENVDIPGLARAMDTFFWSLLAQAGRLSQAELDRWIDSATHLIYHAMFTDPPQRGGEIVRLIRREELHGFPAFPETAGRWRGHGQRNDYWRKRRRQSGAPESGARFRPIQKVRAADSRWFCPTIWFFPR